MPQAGCTSETTPAWNPPHVNQLQNLIVSLWLAFGELQYPLQCWFWNHRFQKRPGTSAGFMHISYSSTERSRCRERTPSREWRRHKMEPSDSTGSLGQEAQNQRQACTLWLRIWTAPRYLLKQGGGGLRSAIWQLLLYITLGVSTGDPPGRSFRWWQPFLKPNWGI